jgi:opacity protein-like surface antigen
MRRRWGALAGAAAAAVIAAPASATPQTNREHARSGFTAGAAIGGGGTFLQEPGTHSGSFRAGESFNLRVGWAWESVLRGADVVVGLQASGGLRELASRDDFTASYFLLDRSLAVAVYPGASGTHLNALYARAGVGVADVELEQRVPTLSERTESGWGLSLDIGYELRVATKLALALGTGVHWIRVDEDAFPESRFTPIWLELTYYGILLPPCGNCD